jgi:phosphonate degradation associated HDIG domain protein
VNDEPIVRIVAELFERSGGEQCFGEEVTQRDHALQCALLATEVAAKPSLVVAALLHDVGHLLLASPQIAATYDAGGHHERIGCLWLAQYFGPDVVEPVRLHVDAKRFLCTVDPDYLEALSAASSRSFALQGGAMTEEEVTEFELQAYARDAVRLRRWDDQAKVPGLEVPGLEQYSAALVGLTRHSIARV